MEYTKGKWIVGVSCRIRDSKDNSIALCSGDASSFGWHINEANAERICKCVNGWDDLTEALLKFGDHLESCPCYIHKGEWDANNHHTAKTSDLEVTELSDKTYLTTKKCTCGFEQAIQKAKNDQS